MLFWGTGVTSAVETLNSKGNLWIRANQRTLSEFLGAQAKDYPAVRDVPWTDASVRGQSRAQVLHVKEVVDANLEVIDGLLDELGVVTAIPSARAETRFAELRQSGLIEADALTDYLTRINRMTTRPQIAGSLAASKELVEAVYRATCDVLGVTWEAKETFEVVGKRARNAMLQREVDGGLITEKLRDGVAMMLGGIGTIDQSLATLRNQGGYGHGRKAFNKEVAERHALLAADLADTLSRYVVLSLRSLGFVVVS